MRRVEQETSGASTPVRCQWSRGERATARRRIPASTKKDVNALHLDRTNARGLAYLAGDWVVILLAGAAAHLSGMQPVVYVAAVLLIGSRQKALRSLVHEASHYKLCSNRDLNLWAGRLLAAWPVIGSLSGYLCSHCLHHRYLWDSERDPKRHHYSRIGLVRPGDGARFMRHHLLLPLLLLHVPSYVAFDLSTRDERTDESVLRYGFFTIVALTAFLTGTAGTLALLWVVPYLTVYQVLRYWSDIADHAGLPSADPFQNTRSWDGNWLVRAALAPHAGNLHLAHHLFPGVPHHRMRDADARLRGVDAYRQAHHCDGFLLPRSADKPSVIQDVLHPERMAGFHDGTIANGRDRWCAFLGRPCGHENGDALRTGGATTADGA